MGDPWAAVGLELPPDQGVNNLCIFAIEKKAQRRRMFNLKI
jgi:hypothetical protein